MTPLPPPNGGVIGLCNYYTKHMFKSYGAILFGMTMGFLSLIPLQALNNSQARTKCTDNTDTHTLVYVRAFAGDANYCVDNRYL